MALLVVVAWRLLVCCRDHGAPPSPVICSCRLLNDRGDLLVCTCPVKDVGQEKVCAAISSNIWAEYCKAARSALDGSGELEFLILDFEEGKVAIASVCGGAYILCSHTASDVHMGMVRAKVRPPPCLTAALSSAPADV